MMTLQIIEMDNVESWTDEDFIKLKEIYQIESKEDVVFLWESNQIIRISDAKDYEYAYQDFLRDDNYVKIGFDEFVKELKKGYGNSNYLPIARLIELSNGIYYDNEYC